MLKFAREIKNRKYPTLWNRECDAYVDTHGAFIHCVYNTPTVDGKLDWSSITSKLCSIDGMNNLDEDATGSKLLDCRNNNIVLKDVLRERWNSIAKVCHYFD